MFFAGGATFVEFKQTAEYVPYRLSTLTHSPPTPPFHLVIVRVEERSGLQVVPVLEAGEGFEGEEGEPS